MIPNIIPAKQIYRGWNTPGANRRMFDPRNRPVPFLVLDDRVEVSPGQLARGELNIPKALYDYLFMRKRTKLLLRDPCVIGINSRFVVVDPCQFAKRLQAHHLIERLKTEIDHDDLIIRPFQPIPRERLTVIDPDQLALWIDRLHDRRRAMPVQIRTMIKTFHKPTLLFYNPAPGAFGKTLSKFRLNNREAPPIFQSPWFARQPG
jgi:hypothetical protein